MIENVKEFIPPDPVSPLSLAVRDAIRSTGSHRASDLFPVVIAQMENHRRLKTRIRAAEKDTGWSYEEYIWASIKWGLLWEIISQTEERFDDELST